MTPPSFAAPEASTPTAVPAAAPLEAVEPPDAADALAIDTLMERTARLRGRAFRRPVDWRVVTAAEMRAQFADAQLDADGIALTAKVLKKLGLIPADLDLWTTLVDLLGEQVVGYYDPDRKALFALDMTTLTAAPVPEPAAARAELAHTMVHELTHALQDQHFDLAALIDNDALERGELLDDEIAARLALAEGDAMAVALDYSLGRPGDRPPSLGLSPALIDRFIELTLDADALQGARLAAAPPYIRQSLYFPYTTGLKFVVHLRQAGGWAAVDETYARVPESTEQILHVEKYVTPDHPTPVPPVDLTRVLGRAWHPERAANLGELDVHLLIQEYLGRERAASMSTGWDGDRLFLFSHKKTGALLLVWASVWDTAADAREFADGYAEVLALRYGEARRRTAERRLWRTAAGEVSLERRGHWVVVIDALPARRRARVARRVWAAVAPVRPTP